MIFFLKPENKSAKVPNLEAVFARVAAASDDARDARDFSVSGGHESELGEVKCRHQRLQHSSSQRPLSTWKNMAGAEKSGTEKNALEEQ